MEQVDEQNHKPNVYIAGKWSRREELLAFAFDLHDVGCNITSSWLWADKEEGEEYYKEYAVRDIEDISKSEVFILFTFAETELTVRNSRLVELGFALAWLKEVIIIGPRENIFCHLNIVRHCADTDEFWREIDLVEENENKEG